MRPQTVAFTMDALDRNGISIAQTPAVAGNLSITGALATGGVATMDVPRHVAIYSDADESGDTYTITGTDRYGAALTETITGPNTTTVNGSKNFLTVTQVATSGAGTGNIEVGTGPEADTKVYPVDRYSDKLSYSVSRSSGAGLTYNFKYTLDPIWFPRGSTSSFSEDSATWFTDLGPKIVNTASASAAPITAWRLEVTSFTTGTATVQVHCLSGMGG